MKTNNVTTLIGIGIAAATISAVAQPADAFVITNTSASWDNVSLNGGQLVGSDGVAASEENYVNFLNQDDDSQVRWGVAANGWTKEYYWDTVEKEVEVEKEKYVWRKVYKKGKPVYKKNGKPKYKKVKVKYKTTETVQQQVKKFNWKRPSSDYQSGLGYEGVSNLNIEAGDIFNIGQLTHFNQTIYDYGLIGENAEFSLNLDFGENSIGSQQFNFAFSIDETLNQQEVCPYQTEEGKGCSDQITWDFSIDQENSFTYQNEEYALELVGFGKELASKGIVNEFISQEGQNNSANLFARLVKVDRTQDIPEPTSLLGLAGMGLFFARSRKKKSEETA